MKKSFIIMALLAMAVVLIPACSKDDDNENEEEKTPTASFTMSSDSVFVNDTVYFTNESIDAASYLWDFGDEQTSTETSPNHSYSNAGDYTVTLTACSATGTKSDKTTKIIKVNKQETIDPVASFTVSNDSVFVNDTVYFTNTSTNAASYLWDFGDGESSTETSPTHSYSNAGDYTVTLTACSADSTKSDETTKIIKVNNQETIDPVASFTVSPETIYVNEVVTFTNTSTNAESYLWDFGDEQTSTDISPVHSYSTAGNYTITLTAYSVDGTKSDEATKNIEILALPEASFTMSSEEVYVDETVTFTNESTNAGSYLWDFGDGESSTETSPVHSYSTAGSYTITLTAYSVDGTKSDEATKNIEILALPEASFTMSSNEVYVDETVTFTNTSTNAGSYLWDFGDGESSTDISPVHSYSTAGNYTITLTAYSVDGTKSDEATASIQVNDNQGSNLTIQVNGVSFEMIYVEGGTFWMGAQSTDPNGQNYDPEAYDWESPVHQVTLDSYYIGEFEVTQELWKAIMGSNPSSFTGDLQRPVEQVSWNDIVNNFIPALNAATGRTFALPTEAQWEFAARGGNESQGYKYSGSNNVDDVAWYGYDPSTGSTHPVGQKQDNELNTYDMSGNVFEWCFDWYEEYSSEPQTNPQGPATGSFCIIRGGGWYNYADGCRVSYRDYDIPSHFSYYGFRLVLLP